MVENENMEFELNIDDNVEPTQWVEVDPFNTNQFCDIVLTVDWDRKTVSVDTQYGNGIDSRVFHHLASEFRLHNDVDASTFKEYYDEKIRPIILKMSEFFESYWDGSNWRGRFVSGETDECGYDLYDSNLDEFEIYELCRESPTHDKYIYTDVRESFQSYEDIVDDLKYDDIDFMTVDLDDMKNILKIREYLTDDCIYIMSDEQFQSDLISMRETIIENAEGSGE